MADLNNLLEEEERAVTCVYNKAHKVTRFRCALKLVRIS